ncbi:uncharacterized protein [Battus philenor]|uniref:uncharacterized protein n=1 Tax=Battus philenor TaxID=42288 RepID=UPI0035D065F2
MDRYNAYMDNIRRSKKIALDLIEDTKDAIESGALSPVSNTVKLKHTPSIEEYNTPSTSQDKNKKQTEYIKYGKITFNTTAILHHYPQIQNKNTADTCAVRKTVTTKKSDPAVTKERSDNNNDVKSENIEIKITVEDVKDSRNNNSTANSRVELNEETKKPVKFAEEKLV